LAAAPPIASTVSATSPTLMARRGRRCPVKTMPAIAPQTPVRIATGTAIASASGQMLVGHG
jgi:hypothetical protein